MLRQKRHAALCVDAVCLHPSSVHLVWRSCLNKLFRRCWSYLCLAGIFRAAYVRCVLIVEVELEVLDC